jgi:murein DD-endopeptidase MepM/ murein hydrolase activator NlpD
VTLRALVLVLLLVLAVGAGGALFVRCEGSAPSITVPERLVVGRDGAELEILASDPGSGLRQLRADLVHARGQVALAQHEVPGDLLLGGQRGDEVRLPVQIDVQALELREGDAILRVTARDWSWRGAFSGNQVELEIPVRVDLTPPRLRIRSGLTYVRRAGSAAVVYDLAESAERDGVEVADVFFPGMPLPGAKDGRHRVALFSVPRDAVAEPALRVVAVDEAGNRRAGRWGVRVQERSFQEVPIKLPAAFLERKVTELASELGVEADDPVAAFQDINSRVRAENEAQIRKIVEGSSHEKLFEGAFLQLPNSQVTSRFAEHRSYFVGDEQVSEAIHYGYDLASRAHASIVAANRGRVLYADDLGIYGQTVILDHGLGVTSLYGHLSDIGVSAGDLVEKGDELGRSGETGLAGGDHLHFAILVGGSYVDPLEWWDPKWVREHVESHLVAP